MLEKRRLEGDGGDGSHHPFRARTLAGAPGVFAAPTAVGYRSTNSFDLLSRSMTTPSYGSPRSSSASHARCANGQMGAYQNVSGAAGGMVGTAKRRTMWVLSAAGAGKHAEMVCVERGQRGSTRRCSCD